MNMIVNTVWSHALTPLCALQAAAPAPPAPLADQVVDGWDAQLVVSVLSCQAVVC